MSAFTTQVKPDNLPFDAHFSGSLEREGSTKNRKPKNLRKRGVDSIQDIDSSCNGLDSSVKVEQIRCWQQFRASRLRRSPLSAEGESDCQKPQAKKTVTGSLSSNFTAQVETVDPLDERLGAYIEQEMIKRRAQLQKDKEGVSDFEASQNSPKVDSRAESNDSTEEASSAASNVFQGGLEGGNHVSSSLPDTPKPVIVDLSHRVLKASSTSSSAYNMHDYERRWYKEAPSRPMTAILEVDLPVEDQLKIIEETNLVARQRSETQRQRAARSHPGDSVKKTGFEGLDHVSVPRHYNSDFSKYLRYQSAHGNRLMDDIVYNRYRKSQSYK